MDQQIFNKILDDTIEAMRKLSTLKGGEYAGDTDRLANFKRNAAAFGVSPLLVWGVYAGKHWDAIAQFINDHQNGTYRQRGEAVEGRLDDMIVYCVLMKAMLQESTTQPQRIASDPYNIKIPNKCPQCNRFFDADVEALGSCLGHIGLVPSKV